MPGSPPSMVLLVRVMRPFRTPLLPSSSGIAASARLNLFVGDAQAEPGIFHGLVIPLRIIDRDVQAQFGCCQTTDRGQKAIAGHNLIALRTHTSDLRVKQLLLLIEQIKDGT